MSKKSWAQWASSEAQSIIRAAEDAFSRGNIEVGKAMLGPLAVGREPAANVLLAQLSSEDEPQESHEQRLLDAVTKAAEASFPPALYLLGYYYDEGECGLPVDRIRAANLFRAAAERGHAQSQWIHGIDLLRGTNGVSANEARGRQLLLSACEAGLQRALESVAEFHREGRHGFRQDAALAAEYGRRAAVADNWI